VAGFRSVCRPASRRNGGRLEIGIPGRLRRNTQQQIANRVNQTGGALYALGSWHNHLAPSEPSSLDARTAKLLAELQLSPVLLLIYTPTGYTFLSAETDATGCATQILSAGTTARR